MSIETRRARVLALAKLNLSLKVLHKRPDGFHELRTIFQTISLADAIEVEYSPGRRSKILLEGNVEITDNLITKAAELIMRKKGAPGTVLFRMNKRIPMGAGLGGGSSDAAAVLLALPALTGRRIPLAELTEMGTQLGSDVPFFLLGGTAVALGRGTELYPMPDIRSGPGLLVAPAVHVSTAEAYRALSRKLTNGLQEPTMKKFQSCAWMAGTPPGQGWEPFAENDFEVAVFVQHPHLQSIRRRLERAGARPSRMTGSGSAIFGIFRTRDEVRLARERLKQEECVPFRVVSRSQYRSLWWGRLREHITDKVWPPQSRYAR